MRRLLYIAYFFEVGLFLILIPWSEFWDHNYFVYALPVLRPLLLNNFIRGAVSGLGLVNLLVGLAELVFWIGRGRERRAAWSLKAEG